jgi:hypothetical protein
MTATTHFTVAVNDIGRAIGQDHPMASLTDREVELMRTMHEKGCGPTELAKAFGITKRYCIKVLQYEVRNHTTAGHRKWVKRAAQSS